MPGLYLHIPFCEHKCVYCDFYSIAPDEERSRLGEYTPRFVAALLAEIDQRSSVTPAAKPFDTVFFGGGTPSLLDPEDMRRIVARLRERFVIGEDAEWTLEANPGTVRRASLAAFRGLGFNRISFGVQSFDAGELAFLTRIHSAEQARASVRDARSVGFENISIDLIFNIPGQTTDSWCASIDDAIALETEHVSCYSLTVERNTPLARLVEGGTVRMPSQEMDESQYALTIERLKRAGFEQYEVSNFARGGRRSRHNLNYWLHGQYIGFGPSAHSYWGKKRWWNVANLSMYQDAIAKGRLPVSGEEDLTNDQLMSEHLLLGLRSVGVNVEEFDRRFSRRFMTEHQERVQAMLSKGLARLDGPVLSLTERGYMVCDEICASLS